MNMMHEPECEWTDYQLCTCGVIQREQDKKDEARRIEYTAKRAKSLRDYHRSRQNQLLRGFFFKLIGFVLWGYLYEASKTAGGIIMGFILLWAALKSVLWFFEAHWLHGDPSLKGPGGYLGFMLR